LQLIVWIELFNSLKRCQETIKHTQKKEKRKKKKKKKRTRANLEWKVWPSDDTTGRMRNTFLNGVWSSLKKKKKNFKDTGFLISNVSVVRGQSWFEGCLKISIWSMKCVVATIFECILLLCCCNCMCFLLQTFPFMSINFFHIFVKMKSNTLVQYQLFSLARLIL
jgi:hypothetical protein